MKNTPDEPGRNLADCTEPTPGEWSASYGAGSWCVTAPDPATGSPVLVANRMSEPDAKKTALCVNRHDGLCAALKAAETALDFQLTTCQSLANHMDDATGLAIIYELANTVGKELEAIRDAIAKAKGAQ